MRNQKTWRFATLVLLVAITGAVYMKTNEAQAKPSVISGTVEMQQSAINLQSYGKTINCIVELPGGYDVNDIEIRSVKINDSIHVIQNAPIIIGDNNNNAITDVTLTFDRTEIVDFLIGTITNESITLTISGVVAKVPFEGYYSIMVSNLLGDVNCDGIVNINDIIEAIASFNTEDGESNWNSNANYAPIWDKLDLHDLVTIAYHYGEIHP